MCKIYLFFFLVMKFGEVTIHLIRRLGKIKVEFAQSQNGQNISQVDLGPV